MNPVYTYDDNGVLSTELPASATSSNFLENLGTALGEAFGNVANTAIQTGQNVANAAIQTANPPATPAASAPMTAQTKMILVGVGLLAVLFVVREYQKEITP